MVCSRCIMAVSDELKKLGLDTDRIDLGEVVLKTDPDAQQLARLDESLLKLGFERLDDKKSKLIEAIKNTVIQQIHHANTANRKHNWSDILADELQHDYNHLSTLFSGVEGITLEQYIIRQKVERAKELISYEELNVSEIADRLGYSSVAHLSAQFKKITGLTPSDFKKHHASHLRKPLDGIL